MVNLLRGGMLFTGLKGFYNTTRYQLQLSRADLKIRNLPLFFRGFKIALLSDFHSSFLVGEAVISKAREMAMRERPDMIALTGDFVTGTNEVGGSKSESLEKFDVKYVDSCARALKGLSAPLGIYGVLGNHDFWCGKEAIDAIYSTFERQLGVKWLRNENVTLAGDGGQIDILGVDDYWEKSCSLRDAFKGLRDDTVKVLLSHNPDINVEIEAHRKRVDVVLSGHTHGGQVVLPIVGSPFLPSTMGQKYLRGIIKDDSRQTCVTNGIGINIVPLRYNCPPEVTLITLYGE